MNDAGGRKIPVAVDARLYGGDSTGDSTYWTSLLRALARLPDAPEIVLFSDRPLPDAPFPVRVVPARSGRWWSLVTFPLTARRFGAVHVQYALSPLVRRGVSTVHDVSFLVGPEWFRPRDRLLLTLGVRAAGRRARRIVTVSQTSRAEIERLVPGASGKTVGIPNACPDWIVPADPAPVLSRLGIERPYLLTVGTRWPRKNMGLAVDAADRLDHRLVVTGKAGWGDQELGRRGVATGYVAHADLGALYAGAEGYLAPSRHEGFGVPVLEAFRCGAPVFASSGGALPEVVGEAGRLIPSWDADDWAAALAGVLPDPGKLDAMRAAGRERERLFTWDASARAHAEVYREVAAE